MTDALAVAAGLVLPWLAGFALLSLAQTRGPSLTRTALAGYGLVTGLLLTTGLLRASSGLGIPFSVVTIAAVLGLVVMVAGPFYFRFRRTRPVGRMPFEWDWVIVALLGWIAIRAATLTVGNALQPLVGVDTWWFWASKARVWYENGAMSPFVWFGMWVDVPHGAEMVYWDPQPAYPALVPLSKTWMALALGRWDEALTNSVYLGLFAALLLAFYGQLRPQLSARRALLFTALLAGLPMLDANVFAAGLADLFVGVGFCLAAMALYRYAASRDPRQLLLLAVGVVFLLSAKRVSVLWLACLAPGAVIALFPRRAWWPLLTAGVMLGAGVAVVAAVTDVRVLGMTWSKLKPHFRSDAMGPVLVTLFVGEGWHLLWAGLGIGWVAALLRRRLDRPAVALSLVVLSALGVLAGLFVFSAFADWAGGMHALPRHLLHVAPTAMFLCAVLWSALFEPRQPA